MNNEALCLFSEEGSRKESCGLQFAAEAASAASAPWVLHRAPSAENS